VSGGERRRRSRAASGGGAALSAPADGEWLGRLDALADRLAGLNRGAKPPLVTLRADRGIDYGRVMAVMGELNHAGFNSISLVTSSVTGGSSEAP
jgi:hypothetical protein